MLYSIARFFCNIIIHIIFKIEIKGMEYFPEEGATILYSNHKSNWDPVIIGGITKRPVFFMAKHELFENKILGWFLRKLHAFPVKRQKVDRGALKQGLKILENGQVLGIFPEGTRSKTGKVSAPEQGIAFFASRSDALLVPVAIKGSYKLFSKIEIIFGAPKRLVLPRKKVDAEKRKQITEEIFDELVKLLR